MLFTQKFKYEKAFQKRKVCVTKPNSGIKKKSNRNEGSGSAVRQIELCVVVADGN